MTVCGEQARLAGGTANRPVVLLGEFWTGRSPASPYLARNGWGRMWVTGGPLFEYPGEPYGLDNGAYSCWRKGRPFDEGRFLRRLDAVVGSGREPTLAVTPDIVAGGRASLDFSLAWLDRLPASLPWYLAVQDGMTPAEIEPHVARFSGVFLGGSDAFKRDVRTWREWTAELGLPLHYGRCGTIGKLRDAMDAGVDSLDSAFPVLKAGYGQMHVINRFEREWFGLSPQAEFQFSSCEDTTSG